MKNGRRGREKNEEGKKKAEKKGRNR